MGHRCRPRRILHRPEYQRQRPTRHGLTRGAPQRHPRGVGSAPATMQSHEVLDSYTALSTLCLIPRPPLSLQVALMVTVRILPIPFVAEKRRLLVRSVAGIPHFYQV